MPREIGSNKKNYFTRETTDSIVFITWDFIAVHISVVGSI